MLKNTQKRELSDCVKNTSLRVSDFYLIENDAKFNIQSKKAPWQYKITVLNGHFEISHSLGKTVIQEYNTVNWFSVISNFEDWLSELEKEVATVDTGWDEGPDNLFGPEGEESFDSKFTKQEVIDIKKSLDQLKDSIKELALLPQQLEFANRKLDLLYNLTVETNKFDWKAQFVGTIFNLITYFMLPPETAGLLWGYVKAAFQNLFRLN